MNAAKYEFVPGEAGTLVEIYLPTRYHSVLLQILERGLDFEYVVKSFPATLADDCLASRELKTVLPEWLRSNDNYVSTLAKLSVSRGVCFGFSVFKVDGAFADGTGISPRRVIREQVTVVRIIVRPDFASLYASHDVDRDNAHKVTKWFFGSGLRAEDIAENSPWNGGLIDGDAKKLVDRLGDWQNITALFVYGFIVRRIIEIPEIDEQEIWVTSYHNPVVNVIKRLA